MHKLITLAAALAVLGAAVVADGSVASTEAQQKRKQARPPPQPKVLRERDRFFFNTPQRPERNFYGPAPGIQQPMERVPMPAPLAEPPINR
jgi:hypothetical protein